MHHYLPQFWEAITFLVYPIASFSCALVCLIVSFYWINLMKRKIENKHINPLMEPIPRKFLLNFISLSLKLCIVVCIANTLGIKSVSIVALLGSLSISISLALQGGLSNFAGGFSLLFFQPFKVGDTIEVEGMSGEVEQITLYFTSIITDQRKSVLIPNNLLINKIVTNKTLQGTIRIDIKVNVSEATNLTFVRSMLLAAITNTKGVLANPAPCVNILNMLDGDIQLICQAYCLSQEDESVGFACTENIHKALKINAIDAPVPHKVLIASPLTRFPH